LHLNYIGNDSPPSVGQHLELLYSFVILNEFPKSQADVTCTIKQEKRRFYFIPFAGNVLLQVTVKILKNKAKDKNSLRARNYKQQIWSEYVILGTECISDASSSFQCLDGFRFVFAESFKLHALVRWKRTDCF